MNVHNIKLLESLYPANSSQALSKTDELSSGTFQKEHTTTFSDVITNSIQNLEEKQLASDHAIQGLVSGEADNLHNVMIKTTEAQLALELAVQLRNRSLEAMNEIKNMQF